MINIKSKDIEELVEDDQIDSVEAGFMEGYHNPENQDEVMD